jgi:hypothetical protein
MQFTNTPGYTFIFGDTAETYGSLVEGIPSDEIILMATSLNVELYTDESVYANQTRLLAIIQSCMPIDAIDHLGRGLRRFRAMLDRSVEVQFFERHYLLGWIVQELKAYRPLPPVMITNDQRFRMFKAYLMAVDQVNAERLAIRTQVQQYYEITDDKYSVLWTESISQLEFTEIANLSFELFKTQCVARYLKATYRSYLRDFLAQLGIQTIGQWLGHTVEIAAPLAPEKKEQLFHRARPIQPGPGVDVSLLQYLSLASKGPDSSFLDLKKKPLHHWQGLYRVIDPNFFQQIYYRGFYIGLFRETTLSDVFAQNRRDFGHFNSEIALAVLEQTCFRAIIRLLRSNMHDVILFDNDNSRDGHPDAYVRHNRIVFLFECKGYLFPERYLLEPDYQKIRTHVQQKFLSNEDGQAKGVTQIVRQLIQLKKGGLTGDAVFDAQLREQKITVYPVICHDEPNYNMLGLNEYLQDNFRQQLSTMAGSGYRIQRLTLINLKNCYELASRQGTILDLARLIDRYHSIMENRQKKIKREFDATYYNAQVGFDEIFSAIFRPELMRSHPVKDGKRWTDAIGLTQAELDEVI